MSLFSKFFHRPVFHAKDLAVHSVSSNMLGIWTPKISPLSEHHDDFKGIAGDDEIIVNRNTWNSDDTIDGGGGHNTISGTFTHPRNSENPLADDFLQSYGFSDDFHFTPTVRNVQDAKLMAAHGEGTLDFSNWSGIQYAEVHGTGHLATDHDTSFTHLPLGTKIGVTDFTESASFEFAGATGVQTADLTVRDVGHDPDQAEARINIAQMARLDVHVAGDNAFVLSDDALKAIKLDGDGSIDLHLNGSQNLTSVDASGLTGKAAFDIEADHMLTIHAGQGGTTITTTGNYADQITFGAGADVYKPSQFENVYNPSQVGNIAIQANDKGAILITNFDVAHDKIDVSGLGATLFINDHGHDHVLDSMSLADAAKWVAEQATDHTTGIQTVDVFQWHNATYVFNDHDGNRQFDNGDGLIKIDQIDLSHSNFL